MIVLRMSGGLGNQMFQYAFYVKLRSLGREVVFDDYTQYDEETFRDSPQKRRPKRLGIFGIDYPVVSKEELLRITDAAMDPASRIRRKLGGRKSLEKDDRDFIYDPTFLEAEEGYFCGNFQSARYFAGAEDEVRKAFTFPDDILTPKAQDAGGGSAAQKSQRFSAQAAGREQRFSAQAEERERRILAQAAEYERRIRAANERYDQSEKAAFRRDLFCGGSASIHLRFGDYLDKQEIYGGICTDAYYNAAIGKLTALDPDITFFVFSNDRERAGEWVRMQAEKAENRGRSRFVLVQGSDEDHGYLDLYLMSRCRNHIIANSSFSWWGAWLCANPGKITFAPSIWVNQADGSELRRTDIYDRGMRRINPQGHEIGEEPLISVIMAAYNVAPYAERAVNSVLTQTYRNLELIAVDDGSTDGTGDILEACAAKDPRVRVLHRANGGVSAARNDGIGISRGDYIGFVDGDDAARPQMYEALVRAVLASGADIGAVNYREVSESEEDVLRDTGTPAKTEEILGRSVVMNRKRALRTIIRSGVAGGYNGVEMHHNVWTKLYSRRLLEDNLFVVGSSAEDIYFTTHAMCRSGRVVFLRDALYDYLKNRAGSNMTIGRAKRTLNEEIPAWEAHRAMLREIGEDELADESEYLYCRRLLFYVEQYRAAEDTKEQAREIGQILQGYRDRIRELEGRVSCVRRGDRVRLHLYFTSPGLYLALSRMYEKTVVALRNRG